MDIQVDMFDVQLGAALLLQFKVGGKVVRVLADAGTSMSGYGKNHVLEKLRKVLPIDESKPPPRIDLLIGTHYDTDHLNRMVPIIENYEIGEAWLPPVANDTEPPAADWKQPRDNNLLGVQFAGEGGNEKFAQYLKRKAGMIETVAGVRGQVGEAEPDDLVFRKRALYRAPDLPASLPDEEFFERARASATAVIGKSGDHASKDVRPLMPLSKILGDRLGFNAYRKSREPLGDHQVRSLAYIERSTAEDALTAKSLKEVVDALVARQVPTRYEYVQDGRPAYFAWNARQRRFRSVVGPRNNQLSITLLGPSRGLVAKYWERLPVGDYVQFALASRLPVEGITPQNELSYAMVFRHREQGLLVSGDTGFVDFAPLDEPERDAEFHPAMIEALSIELPVVQVAHHGGHNRYFYHALQAADYPVGKSMNYLLLSHEVNGKSRPSKVFAEFMMQLGGKASKVRLLFTSRPRAAAVRDYSDRIGAVVPKGSGMDRGDIRLVYAGNKWTIRKHAIEQVQPG